MSTAEELTAQQLITELAAREVRYGRVEVPDLDGSMRAKLEIGRAHV